MINWSDLRLSIGLNNSPLLWEGEDAGSFVQASHVLFLSWSISEKQILTETSQTCGSPNLLNQDAKPKADEQWMEDRGQQGQKQTRQTARDKLCSYLLTTLITFVKIGPCFSCWSGLSKRLPKHTSGFLAGVEGKLLLLEILCTLNTGPRYPEMDLTWMPPP